jgi:hypothetical protein
MGGVCATGMSAASVNESGERAISRESPNVRHTPARVNLFSGKKIGGICSLLKLSVARFVSF